MKFTLKFRGVITGCFLFVYTFKPPLKPQFSPIFKTLWRCYSQKHVHLEKLQMVQWNKILISKKDKEYNTIFQESQNSVIFLLWLHVQGTDQGTVLSRKSSIEIPIYFIKYMYQWKITSRMHWSQRWTFQEISPNFAIFEISYCNSLPFLLIKILFHHTIFSWQ